MNTIGIISVVIGMFAMLLASITVLPQLIKTIKTRLTVNLSLQTLLVFNFANTLWIVFASLNITLPTLFNSRGSFVASILWSLILFIPYAITWTATTFVIGFKLFNMIKYHESGGNLKKITPEKVTELLNIPADADAAHSKLKPSITNRKAGD